MPPLLAAVPSDTASGCPHFLEHSKRAAVLASKQQQERTYFPPLRSYNFVGGCPSWRGINSCLSTSHSSSRVVRNREAYWITLGPLLFSRRVRSSRSFKHRASRGNVQIVKVSEESSSPQGSEDSSSSIGGQGLQQNLWKGVLGVKGRFLKKGEAAVQQGRLFSKDLYTGTTPERREVAQEEEEESIDEKDRVIISKSKKALKRMHSKAEDYVAHARGELETSINESREGFERYAATIAVEDRVHPLIPLTRPAAIGLGFFILLISWFERWLWNLQEDARGSSFDLPKKQRSSAAAKEEAPALPPPRVQAELTPMAESSSTDMRKKESVEWVNMILIKIWKIYRRDLEAWLVERLQPVLDDMDKPDYVQRIQIKQFYLGEGPLSIRSVERRTSRQAHDLQYHVGLRYTGAARMVLELRMVRSGMGVSIPVGVRQLDVDGEVWVKLRLIPTDPWVGAIQWAFVRQPRIKLALVPFRLLNLMDIPVLSNFLVKLLSEDLPALFVWPRKSFVDLLQDLPPHTRVPGEFPGDKVMTSGTQRFAGELSVTLIEARKLVVLALLGPSTTDPYVVMSLGQQVIRSKRNTETSTIGPPGAPIWNQDFVLLVVDPQRQKLTIRIRDSTLVIGYGEVPLEILQDTVPTDVWVPLTFSFGPLINRPAGEVSLRLTYRAYVDDEEEIIKDMRKAEMEEEGRGIALPVAAGGEKVVAAIKDLAMRADFSVLGLRLPSFPRDSDGFTIEGALPSPEERTEERDDAPLVGSGSWTAGLGSAVRTALGGGGAETSGNGRRAAVREKEQSSTNGAIVVKERGKNGVEVGELVQNGAGVGRGEGGGDGRDEVRCEGRVSGSGWGGEEGAEEERLRLGDARAGDVEKREVVLEGEGEGGGRRGGKGEVERDKEDGEDKRGGGGGRSGGEGGGEVEGEGEGGAEAVQEEEEVGQVAASAAAAGQVAMRRGWLRLTLFEEESTGMLWLLGLTIATIIVAYDMNVANHFNP